MRTKLLWFWKLHSDFLQTRKTCGNRMDWSRNSDGRINYYIWHERTIREKNIAFGKRDNFFLDSLLPSGECRKTESIEWFKDGPVCALTSQRDSERSCSEIASCVSLRAFASFFCEPNQLKQILRFSVARRAYDSDLISKYRHWERERERQTPSE